MERVIRNTLFLCTIVIGIRGSLAAQVAAPRCGQLKEYFIHSDYVASRNIVVWLPPGYSDQKRYAVLYAHDGQMLFDNSKTWNQQSWQLDEALCTLFSSDSCQEAIVVAVPNAGLRRHSEYFPEKVLQYMLPEERDRVLSAQRADSSAVFHADLMADEYLRFLTRELKPFIDQTFSTLANKENTFLMGSSMGGLISLYTLCEYPEIFGGAACLSTHWPGIFTFTEDNPFPTAMLIYLENCVPKLNSHILYMDHGTDTLDQHYPGQQKKVDALLKANAPHGLQWHSKVYEGADHSERAWAARVHIPIYLLTR
jgi:enterochelin esterase-like enzyme